LLLPLKPFIIIDWAHIWIALNIFAPKFRQGTFLAKKRKVPSLLWYSLTKTINLT
jgi:hypothetical protein